MSDPTPTQLLTQVYRQALGYPEAYEEEPWGHPAIKVRKKAFLFCSALTSPDPGLSLKLPVSGDAAKQREGISAMGYGLGRHGWCSLKLSVGVPAERLLNWVDESYRAIAPKSLVKKLGEGRPPLAPMPVVADRELEEVPRVVLVGAGPKRLGRAASALADAGIPAIQVDLAEAVAVVGDLQPEVLLVDLGREAVRVREVAARLAVVCDAALWATGLRDATHESAARRELPRALGFSREPPGDQGTLAAVIAWLQNA